jgi:hypothetical protein
MVVETDTAASWIAPWWFIVAVSVVLGVCAGVGSVLFDGLGPDPESLPGWLSFTIGLTVVGGGKAIQLSLRRRKRLRNNT